MKIEEFSKSSMEITQKLNSFSNQITEIEKLNNFPGNQAFQKLFQIEKQIRRNLRKSFMKDS
jgi:hypothetical protein